MKFKVRDGFVVNRIDRVTLPDDSIVERTTNAYAGETLDLTADQAKEHLHQLEPIDREAKAFVESRFVPVSEATQVAGALGADVQSAIAEGIKAGVAAALAIAQQAAVAAAAQPAEPAA